MGAKLALLASLFGGALAAQQPMPFNGLTPPPGYRQNPAKKGVINPNADRAPVISSSGKVMYFHKPANATTPDSHPELVAAEVPATNPAPSVPVSAPADSALIPSVLPTEILSNDQRLAQAPTPPAQSPRSVMEQRALPGTPDTVVTSSARPRWALPAAARAEDTAPAKPMVPPAPIAEEGGPTVRTSQKQPADPFMRPLDPSYAAAVRLPARDKIFVIYDDSDLERAIISSVRYDVQKRMKDGVKAPEKEFKDDEKYYRFPDLSRLVPEGTVYHAKTDQYPPRTECYEPAYVVHRKLHFEQKNPERAGWDLGIVQPVASTLVFYKDVLLWPHNLASSIHNAWDTSAGKCLPGSPTPYYVYPPEFTVTGSVAEIGIITATAFIFP